MASFASRLTELNEARGHLSVGIDPRPARFPAGYEEASGFEAWCLDLIDATSGHAAAFKPNLAFFLEVGPAGVEALEAVASAARKTGALVLLDAKFADIGSTAQSYAAFTADVVGADAVTLNPYLGTDVLAPFQERGLGCFVLARTTNPGAASLQEAVADRVLSLFADQDVGFVAPGTDPPALAAVRAAVPNAPLLVPGVGAQGGTPEDAARAAAGGPFLVNVSRGIAEAEGTFPESAEAAAQRLKAALAP